MEKFILRLSSHESNMCKTLCSLMESQILVDLTINCKSYSLKIHKCVLAAKSGYFREKLQKDVTIDRILINGMKPSVLKSLITFIYCGGTSVAAEDMHDLISAADYFRIPGIMSILKDKFKIDLSKKPELNLEETPPIFFSNNNKIKTTKYNYNTMPIGVLSGKCNAPGKSKEARYLLAKEQAASQLALEAVQKNKSKLIVTDETCTEVTVEAELAPDFDDSEPIQEYILEDLNKNGLKPSAPVESYNGHINEVFVLQPDNEQFVNDNNRVLDELPAGHTVSYQLIPQNKGDLEIQEYICNTINDYDVNSSSNVCYDIIPEKKIQMTYAEISSAAVSDTYNSNDETVTIIEDCNSNVNAANESYITNEDSPRLIAKYTSNVENHTVDEEYTSNVDTSAENTDYSSSGNSNTLNDMYIANENTNIEVENANVKTNANYSSNLQSDSLIENYNVETNTDNKTCDPNVETNTTVENDTDKVETETVHETINSNIVGYNSYVATNTANENHSSSIIVLIDSQDSSSSELTQKSDIIPVSSNQKVIVSDTYGEDSEKSIYETSGRCSVVDKILPNYNLEYSDNAVAYTDMMNTANKPLLKRKYHDILSVSSPCKNDHSKDENNVQNFNRDMPKPMKYSKNCDEYEMNNVKSFRNKNSVFSVTRPQVTKTVTQSGILLTENGIDGEKCIYDDTKESYNFGAKSKISNLSTPSANDFLTLDNHKEEGIESKENRRQTRSSTKRFTM